MNGNIVAGIVALVLVLACGIAEVVLLADAYEKMHDMCLDIIAMSDEGTLTEKQYDAFRNEWVKLRETSELLLPHVDVYEINLRFAEADAYVKQGDYAQVTAQLTVVEELLKYVPHLMIPTLRHIV